MKRITIDSQDYVLQFWDVAGQPRFKEVRSAYYNNSHGIILVFDLTIKHSFENLAHWITEVANNSNINPLGIPAVILGNKLDLRGEPGIDCISHEEGQTYAQELSLVSKSNVMYFETSALVGLNVETAFESLIKSITMQDKDFE